MRTKPVRRRSLFPAVLSICLFLSASLAVSAQGTEQKKTAEKQTDKNENVLTEVQIPAQFPGGLNAWARYLERTLNRDLLTNAKAAPGRYTVVVSFIVDKDGSLSEVKAQNDPGYGTAAEAERVLQKGPKWLPAVQNGEKVKYRHKQSITFVQN